MIRDIYTDKHVAAITMLNIVRTILERRKKIERIY